MHEQKGILIAAAFAMLGLAGDAAAQKDAAEKVQEGGIEHWIEYYKAERKPAAAPQPQPTTPPPGQAAPNPSTQVKGKQ